MFLNINKPKGWSSFAVVKKVKYTLKQKKVGHAGTLDPLATGVLVIATNEDTKKIEKIQDGIKEYCMDFILGAETKSLDAEFWPDKFWNLDSDLNKKNLDQLVKNNLLGKIKQIPPHFSALKIKGKRAYKLARKNQDFEMPPREVEIYKFEIVDFNKINLDDLNKIQNQVNPGLDKGLISEQILEQKQNFNFIYARAIIECSKGTYIRSLARDLGRLIEAGGYLTELTRVRVGEYRLEDSLNINNLGEIKIEK